MHPDLARYLRQQAELGGSELYVPRAPFPVPRTDPAALLPSSVIEDSSSEPSVSSRRLDFPVENTEQTENRERGTGHGEPVARAAVAKWRKDAPPIPGPGLTVTPPDPTLVDELSRLDSLEAVATMVSGCRKCVLCQTRTNTVPGEGNPHARLMCIGEGPGATEDETGRPFVGAAGQLLDQILGAIECPRDTVYIANIVKCRPPGNRKPLPDEATSCLPYLHRQIALVRPKVLLAMGGTAAEWMLGVKRSLGDLRGKVHRFAGIPLIVTYHPAALLRNPNWKKPTWDDVRIARQLLELD